MLFPLIGQVIEGTSDVLTGAISTLHRSTDDTLDVLGLSAFVPPAVHEVSDGILGLTQRGVHDIGHTTGGILKSFGNMPLHAHDKSIGGNLRNPPQRGQSAQPMCQWCMARPQAANIDYCSRKCGNEAQSAAPKGRYVTSAQRLCEWCNENPQAGGTEYCSGRCANQAAQAMQGRRTQNVPLCQWCMEQPQAGAFGYCGMACADEAQHAGQGARPRGVPSGRSVQLLCQSCMANPQMGDLGYCRACIVQAQQTSGVWSQYGLRFC